MKKVWIIAALVGLCAVATSTFADVQNIRLSGDVRVRGYYLQNANDTPSFVAGDQSTINHRDNSFIVQRTRVKIEADLEDHVLVVVTLKADNRWTTTATPGFGGVGINGTEKTFAVGISESYVQFNEMFYSPATLKLGRQYLHYGRGLILSSVDQYYNYDAGRLVLDFYPFTVDLVGAKMADGWSGSAVNPGHSGQNLLFLNARYEKKDSILKDVEAYFGWLANASANNPSPSGIPGWQQPASASPWILGIRGDLTPIKGLSVWFEGAYEGGSSGTQIPALPAGQGGNIQALLANVGAKYMFGKDVKMAPEVHAEYTYASGGGTGTAPGVAFNNQNAFRPWAGVVEGYNGYLFAPSLSNIHILNVGASIKPVQNVTVALQLYYYLKADSDTFAGSDGNIDFGGLSTLSGFQADKRELGQEVDLIVGYDYSKDVRFQIIGAAFIPGRAFTNARGGSGTAQDNSTLGASEGIDRVITEIRGEVNVKF